MRSWAASWRQSESRSTRCLNAIACARCSRFLLRARCCCLSALSRCSETSMSGPRAGFCAGCRSFTLFTARVIAQHAIEGSGRDGPGEQQNFIEEARDEKDSEQERLEAQERQGCRQLEWCEVKEHQGEEPLQRLEAQEHQGEEHEAQAHGHQVDAFDREVNRIQGEGCVSEDDGRREGCRRS